MITDLGKSDESKSDTKKMDTLKSYHRTIVEKNSKNKQFNKIFFGNNKKCSHVGLYKGKKVYWHSSGKENGRNGIGIDELQPTNKNRISTFYSSRLRSIGRVESCHNGNTLP